MNKLTLINILNDLINNFQNNNLDATKYEEIINNTPRLEYNTNQISYNETKFIHNLFHSIPYYKIYDFIKHFINHLYQISTTKKIELISRILESYLIELKMSIEKRLSTEIDLHIYELAKIYYHNNNLQPTKTIKSLKRKISQSDFLAGMEIAENINFKQNTFDFIKEEEINLRETISQKNYQKKYNISKNTQDYIAKHFTQKTFEDFINCLFEIIYTEENKDFLDFFTNIFIKELNTINESVIRKWKTPITKSKEIKGQYSLF